jgi:hypothetical protein
MQVPFRTRNNGGVWKLSVTNFIVQLDYLSVRNLIGPPVHILTWDFSGSDPGVCALSYFLFNIVKLISGLCRFPRVHLRTFVYVRACCV